jgi:hypothetical protein
VVVGLRVPVEEEREGLDLADHGERAYKLLSFSHPRDRKPRPVRAGVSFFARQPRPARRVKRALTGST